MQKIAEAFSKVKEDYLVKNELEEIDAYFKLRWS